MTDPTEAPDNVRWITMQHEIAKQTDQEVKARIKAILTSEEGKVRPTLANHLAFETDTSAEAAVALMKVAAPEQTGSESYETRKEGTGALGLGDLNPDESDQAAAEGVEG